MEGRKFITTNLAPNMIILLSVGRCSFRHVPVDIKDLAGMRLLDSLNNNGVYKWLKRNGVNVVNDTENGRPHKFSLRDGDVLYLVVDEPGEKNMANKLANFKDSDDLPDYIKPLIIRIEGRSDFGSISANDLVTKLEELPRHQQINPNWVEKSVFGEF